MSYMRKSLDKRTSKYGSNRIFVGTKGTEVHLLYGPSEQFFEAQQSMVEISDHPVEWPLPEVNWQIIEENLSGGLQQALEVPIFVFLVKNVSRTCTHQLVRNRIGAGYNQAAMRWVDMSSADFRMPDSIWQGGEQMRQSWIDLAILSRDVYQQAVNLNIPYQDARFALLEAVCTDIICYYSLATLKNLYAQRACYMFQWELRHVVEEFARLASNWQPRFAPMFQRTCERVGRCTFQGWEDVNDCPLPQARKERTWKSDQH